MPPTATITVTTSLTAVHAPGAASEVSVAQVPGTPTSFTAYDPTRSRLSTVGSGSTFRFVPLSDASPFAPGQLIGYLSVPKGSVDFTVTVSRAPNLVDPVVIGDSGSGGYPGLVPAASAGDAVAGKFLKADGSFQVPSGGGGTPGGAGTQVQFNDSGSFGGNANLTFDKSTGTFTVGPNGGNQLIVTPGAQGATLFSGASKFNYTSVTDTGFFVSAGEAGGTGTFAADAGMEFFLSSSGSMDFFGSGNNITMSITADDKLGFFNAAPIVKPTVSGSKGANAALTSLITALKNLGLITDTTT
jgi:hypothetical protein